MEDLNSVFELVESLEKKAIDAEMKKVPLQNEFNQLVKRREEISAQLNFFTGVSTSASTSAEEFLTANGSTFEAYNEWKALKDAPPNQTQH